MAFVDLHVHSTASDGTFSPEQVVALAAGAGLSALALTDHDTLSGVPQAIKAGASCNVEVIPGIEVSSSYEGKEIHILGLFVDMDSPVLSQALEEFRLRRRRRNEEMFRRLDQAGIHLSKEDLCLGSPSTVVTRAHVARALFNRGLGSSMDQVFKKYLQYGGPYCPPKEYMPPKQVMDALLAGGAFVSLAHPFQYKLGDKGTEGLVAYLASLGMKGLEVYHSSHNRLDREKLQVMAAKYGLLPTGGSDFHGSNKPDISIGVGRGALKISSLLLDDIKKAHQTDYFYGK